MEFVVRIDCNFVTAKDTRGAMAWVPEEHDKKAECDKLASEVLDAYIDATGLPLRLYKGESIIDKADEEFFNKTEAPVFTLFLGHISNTTDNKRSTMLDSSRPWRRES
ncbi:MAG: hypothetical protein R2881_01450 [Eubacteriales bacterium]